MEHLTVAKNTIYQSISRVITSLTGFMITIIIARHFGATNFGDFIKITSFVAVFYLIIDFGLNAFFLQYEKAKFKDLFYLRIILSFIAFILLNAVAYILPYNSIAGLGFSDSVKMGIFIFSLTVFSQGIIFSASSVFQKSLNYFHYMVGIIFGSIVNLMLVSLFVSLNFSLFYILSSFVFTNFITSFLLLKFLNKEIFPISFDLRFAKKIIISSWPIGLMLIFNLIYFRIDVLLLSFLSTTKDVGVYGLSFKFFDFLIALPLFLSNAIYPYLIREKNSYNLATLVKKYSLIFLISSIIIAIPFWFISPLFSFIKNEFVLSIIPFRILLTSLPFFFLTSFFQWVLITKGHQKYLMCIYLLSLVLNVILNVIYIPKFSYIASANITVISEGLVFILMLWKIFPLLSLSKKS